MVSVKKKEAAVRFYTLISRCGDVIVDHLFFTRLPYKKYLEQS